MFGARFITRHLESLDTEEKRFRFILEVVSGFNRQIEEQQRVLRMYTRHLKKFRLP